MYNINVRNLLTFFLLFNKHTTFIYASAFIIFIFLSAKNHYMQIASVPSLIDPHTAEVKIIVVESQYSITAP
jgi:hypothetical protein